jgi:flagellar M-ring protein FliF
MLHSHGAGASHGGYDLDDELVKTLLRTLEPVVGAEHVRASVHVEYDLSSSENTEEVYDPKITATLTQQKSEENAGGGGPAGIPGTTSNIPGAAAATATAVTAETQSSHSESETFAVNKSVRHTVQPAGRVKRLAAAVLVDDAIDTVEKNGVKTATRRKRTAEEMKEIEQLAGAAIGLDAQRGDMLAVQNLSFQELPVEKPLPPGKLDNTRKLLTQWSGLLRYAGVLALFLIVYFLMLRPVKKQILISLRELPTRLVRGSRDLATATAAAAGSLEVEVPGVEHAKRAATLKKQLSEKVRTEPAVAGRLVQSWIREGGKE